MSLVTLELQDANCYEINPEFLVGQDLVRVKAANELITGEFILTQATFEKMIDEYFKAFGVSSYSELEDKVTDLQSKLEKKDGAYDELKRAYEDRR